jgi:hypothetical protein
MINIYTWDQDKGWIQTNADTSVEVNQVTYKRDTILLYVDYTKGDETLLELTFGFIDDDISNEIFIDSYLDNDEVINRTIKFSSSGTYRIPVPVSFNEEKVQIKADIIGSIASPGTVNIWVKPNAPVF